MAKTAKKTALVTVAETPAKESKKKSFRKQIELTLLVTFADLKETLGEKKFIKKVKKASKLLASGGAPKVMEATAG